jgi:hypothetical protein
MIETFEDKIRLADRMSYNFAICALDQVAPYHPELISYAVHRVLVSCSPPRQEFDLMLANYYRKHGY